MRGYPVKRSTSRYPTLLATVFITVMLLVLPFFGGSGPSPLSSSANAALDGSFLAAAPVAAVHLPESLEADPALLMNGPISISLAAAVPAVAIADTEHLAQKPVPPPPPPVVVSAASKASGTAERRAAAVATGGGCPGAIGGSAGGAPGATSGGGVAGTSNGDIAGFAAQYNAVRVANCLTPVPFGNFRYDSCMEQRLFWIAEDPSPDPASAWGHDGTPRSDGLAAVGCDGNLAGGSGMAAAGAADRWWASTSHRASLYRPSVGGSMAHVCINFAMTHGDGVLPDEADNFTRAAARWVSC